MKKKVQRNEKRNKGIMIVTILAVLLAILRLPPIILAKEDGQTVRDLRAGCQENNVILQWEYGNVSETDITEYEVYLDKGSGEECLGNGNSLSALPVQAEITDARKTEATYEILVYGTYLEKMEPEEKDPGEITGEENGEGGNTDPEEGENADTEGSVSGNEPEESTHLEEGPQPEYVSKKRLLGSAQVTWIPEYRIIIRVGEHGKVTCENVVYAGGTIEMPVMKKGEERILNVEPEEGYEIRNVGLPDGVAANGSEYSLSGVRDDTELEISFIRKLPAPELKEAGILSSDKQNIAVMREGTEIELSIPGDAGRIYYQFTDSAGESIHPDGWICYEKGILLKDAYGCGVLKAKTVPEDGEDALESDAVTWYYTTLPERPDSLEFVLCKEGKEYELNALNWVAGADTDMIKIYGLEQGKASSETYQYILYLKSGKKTLSAVFDWSAEEKAFLCPLPSAMPDGVYQIGYAVKNAYGEKSDAVYTDFFLASENMPPELKVEETGGKMTQKEDSDSYYANGTLVFACEELHNILSGVKCFEYKIDSGAWQMADGESIVIPIDEIGTNTVISFRLTANTGLTDEKQIVVTKDVIPPGGVDGTLTGELTKIMEETGFDGIYYSPDEPASIELYAPVERESGSGSRILVKYSVREHGEVWEAEASEQILADDDGKYILKFADAPGLQQEGKYTIWFWTEDEAGNHSSLISRTVCYDQTEPEIVWISSMGSLLQHGQFFHEGDDYQYFANHFFTLQFNIRETVSGISRIECFNVADGKNELLYRNDSYNGAIRDGNTTENIAIQKTGRYRLLLKVYDMAGNVNSFIWGDAGFILDDTKPELTVTSSAENIWTNKDVILNITAEDKESGIKEILCTLDGQNIIGQADGMLQVKATDEAKDSQGAEVTVTASNNAGSIASCTSRVLIDKTAPKITLLGITERQVLKETAELTVTIEEKIYDLAEAEITVNRCLDGRDFDYDVGAFRFTDAMSVNTFSFADDGEYRVRVSARDAAGNEAEEKEIAFTVDMTAPTVQLGGVEEGFCYREDAVLWVEVSESFYEDAEVFLKVRREFNGTVQEYELPKMELHEKVSRSVYSFEEEGTYTVEASAVDAAQNASDIKTVTFIVDKTAPEVFIDGFENHLTTDKEVTALFRVSDSNYQGLKVEAGITKQDVEGREIQQDVNFGEIGSKYAEVTKELSEDGKYTLYITVTDAAGNTGSVEKKLIIDTQAPVIRYIEEYDGKYFQTFSLSHTMEEMLLDFTLSDYRITLNGLYYDGVSEIIEEGKYLLEITAQDEAGHRTDKKAEFIVDSTPPTIMFSGVQDGQITYEEVTLSVALKEDQDFITDIFVNGQRQEQQEEWTFSVQDYGTYEVVVNAQDYAGNRETSQITVLYKKKTILTEWFHNKPVFYATIIIFISAMGGIGGRSLKKKKG